MKLAEIRKLLEQYKSGHVVDSQIIRAIPDLLAIAEAAYRLTGCYPTLEYGSDGEAELDMLYAALAKLEGE